MDDKAVTVSDCAEGEESVSDSFVCCVCLDLLYKPIVLACGHVACFWCVHKSMDYCRESHCPICRHPYLYFPTICEMLHSLLVKMYPLGYKRRERQILEEEKQNGVFSPQLDGTRYAKSYVSCFYTFSFFIHVIEHIFNPSSRQDGDTELAESEFPSQDSDSTSCIKSSQQNSGGTLNEVSVTDVLCSSCQRLLFRPAALNCGHVFCEACISVPDNEVIICKICGSPHPSDLPKVCLELNNFLEEKFPEEYAARREELQDKKVQVQQKNPPSGSSSTKSSKKDVTKAFWPTGDCLSWWNDQGSGIHFAVGCDNCGMFPIVGDRHRCTDCKEKVGFDLCGDCYNTRSKRPGRFNQQHTPDHRFELLKSSHPVHALLSIIGGQLVDASGTPVLAVSAMNDLDRDVIPVEPRSNDDNADLEDMIMNLIEDERSMVEDSARSDPDAAVEYRNGDICDGDHDDAQLQNKDSQI